MFQFRNIGIVVIALIAGLLFPKVGRLINDLVIPIVASLIYLSVKDVHFDRQVIRPKLRGIVIALLVSFLVIPITAWTLVPVLDNNGLSVGVIIMSVAPSTAGSAIVWTRLAESDVQATTIISVVSVGLAPILTPILLLLLLGRHLNIAVIPLFTNLGIVLGVTAVLRYCFPTTPFQESQEKYLSQVGVLLLIYISVSSSYILQYSLRALAITSVLIVTVILFSMRLSTFFAEYGVVSCEFEDALFFSSTLKNLGISLLVATSFSLQGVVTAIVIYYVIQQILSSIVVDMPKI